MALLSRTPLRSDPALNQNFVISLIDTSSTLAGVRSGALSALFDVVAGGFSECSGLDLSMKIEEYEQGGDNGRVLKFPGRVSYGNITLKRGVTGNSSLWDWHYGFVEGKVQRRDGIIALLDALHIPQRVWHFRSGLPVKYSGPQLNATQASVAIESLEIAHEGIESGMALLRGLAR